MPVKPPEWRRSVTQGTLAGESRRMPPVNTPHGLSAAMLSRQIPGPERSGPSSLAPDYLMRMAMFVLKRTSICSSQHFMTNDLSFIYQRLCN
jgi:hypothetical protein